MLVKIARVLFYLLLALFFFGVGIPYLEIVLAISALILAIVELM